MPWSDSKLNVRHLTAREQDRVRQAYELGEKMHDGQTRKSGEPYFNHPVAVAQMLAAIGADADTIIAALLHDTVEDTPLTLAEIEQPFGKAVALLVEGVTKLTRTDVAEMPDMDEQIETLRKIFTLMEGDIRIMVIKIVDRLHNMQTVEFLPPGKQRALAQETMEVYVKIADRLCMQDLRDDLEALCLRVLDPSMFERIAELRTQNEQQGEAVLRTMRTKLEKRYPEHEHDVHMRYEHRSWQNLQEQVLAEGAVTGISGISIAFVCDSMDICYQVMGMLHQMWQRELMSFQDFINAPAINGYRGLHTTMILEDGTRVRCKIRTPDMQEYARKGVTAVCFRADMEGLQKALPWTRRISPLSADTQGRSRDFWDSLQSDILGESIVIHGPGDQAVLVPKGSTALDGAFHLFGDEATRIRSILIGGRNTRFDTRLEHAMSINVVLDDMPTVDRLWLESAHTGLTMAAIREALVRGKTDEEKVPIGKDLLQRTMTLNRRGFIEEFDERRLAGAIGRLGYDSLKNMYIAIADGRLEPTTAYYRLFERTGEKPGAQKNPVQQYVVRFSVPKDDMSAMRRLLEVYERYGVQMKNIRLLTPSGGASASFRIFINLAANVQEEFIAAIRRAGGQDAQMRLRTKIEFPLLLLIVVLWGLDPVMAKLMLSSVTMSDLTLIRFITFFAASSVLYARQMYLSPRTFKPLSPLQPTLYLSGISLFLTALFTYFTLSRIPATQYILFIIAGLGTATLLRAIVHRASLWRPALSLAAVAGAVALLMRLQGGNIEGVLGGILSGIGFSAYSSFSKQYQDQVGMIRERYPAYLFWVSGLCLLLSLPLLAFANLSRLPAENILLAVGFSLVFSALPYLIFFELIRRVEGRILETTLPFVCISTILAESLLSSSLIPYYVLPLLVVFFAFYLTSRRAPVTLSSGPKA